MARNDPQMNLRVPMELKENIEKAAFHNGRTITAEAIYRLEQTFKNTHSAVDKIPTEVLMMELSSRLRGCSIVVMENKDIKKAP